MRIAKKKVFNLMDTNGRRGDVTNALQGYLQILDTIQKEKKMNWGKMPESMSQYEFYRRAIEMSPDVFEVHSPYDKLVKQINTFPEFSDALNKYDYDWLKKHAEEYYVLLRQFDKGIEDRARHYTSNLVKLGFTDEERKISPVGELLLDLKKVNRDELEKTLPIDNVNLVYLRQLLKVRIFDNDGTVFYSPLCFAIYALLKKKRIAEKDFCELVQGLNPYVKIDDIDGYIINYKTGDIVEKIEVEIPVELTKTEKICRDTFNSLFKNRKSSSIIEVYWKYYESLWNFNETKSSLDLNNLLSYYECNKEKINKAFGRGQNIFSYKKGERPSVEDFLENYNYLLQPSVNESIYTEFIKSKTIDQIREYSDTTKRMFRATGIISFEKGYVELAYRELCGCIFKNDSMKSLIFGKIYEEVNPYYEDYEDYEGSIFSYFCEVTSLREILQYYPDEEEEIKTNISKEFDNASIKEIPKIVENRRRIEFKKFIEEVYPENKVKRLLSMFRDRNNDKQLKDVVSSDATVPTIYEYIVGIAWYYFSGKRIDLLSSYNLTLSANFEPLLHAGGGQGDIVIYDEDNVVMLEATLMNANSQKRGEWEPVLRHSINLKIDEEISETGRNVTSFFIADEFDCNTINIWKAVASVPLQSSVDKTKFTDNVVIMPISSDELINLMDKSKQYDEIICRVHDLFEVDKTKFDINWRDKFMTKIV